MDNTFPRNYYSNAIIEWVKLNQSTVLFLQGTRGCGKTQIMHDVIQSLNTEGYSCHFFSFEEIVFLQHFESEQAFFDYRGLKWGITQDERAIIILDELQGQPQLITLLQSLSHISCKRQCIVAANIPQISEEQQHIESITIRPFSFYDYLSYLQFHTEYLRIDKYSKVIGNELRQKWQQFLSRGGFPAVIHATTEEQKRQARKEILEKILHHDITFSLSGQDSVLFEQCFQHIMHSQPLGLKIGALQKQFAVSRQRIERIISILLQQQLIHRIDPYMPNAHDYISNQPLIVASDPGLVSFVTEHYGEKRNNLHYMYCFIYNELAKKLQGSAWQIRYIKKKNGSLIDLFVYHLEKKHGFALLLHPKQQSFHPKIRHSDWFPLERSIEWIGISSNHYETASDNYRIIPAFMIENLAQYILEK